MAPPSPKRLSRLAEELEECGLPPGDGREREILLEEVDHALRPQVHEGRAPTGGTLVNPLSAPSSWEPATGLEITRLGTDGVGTPDLRRFVDGLSSWLWRPVGDGPDQVLLFDRPAGSERDLVVLSKALDATVVQRHPSGAVRLVGRFGVLRWEGLEWTLERHVRVWLDALGDSTSNWWPMIEPMLEFAVHDLASAGTGAVLVARQGAMSGPGFQDRLSAPPQLHIAIPAHLTPLRHALAQVDGAAIFDEEGVLRRLGVILSTSKESRVTVPPMGGTRHTSAARYSYDDPSAIVIVVSDDGPVTVLQGGEVLAQSRAPSLPADDGW